MAARTLLHKVLGLTPAARALVLRSFVLLSIVAALLRLRGMARTREYFARFEPSAHGVHCRFAPGEMAQLVGAAAALVRAACLPRALVLWHLLRRGGYAAEIRFGVRRPERGLLDAHAWVELDGRPVNDTADVVQRYAELCVQPDGLTSRSRTGRVNPELGINLQ